MTQEQIRKAIGAHAVWKGRLKAAVDSGKCEITVADASVDNRCEFGKWLYDLHVAPAEKNDYEKVRQLHAAFHKEVGAVLSQALKGNADAAHKAMDIGSPYAKSSVELTAAMMDWSRKAI